MNSTLAPLGKTKVLDGVRDVDIIRRYLSFPQCVLQQPSGRTNKGIPLRSSTSPGCSPTRASGAFGFPAENDLGCRLPELATPTVPAARLRPSMSACSGTHAAAVCVKSLLSLLDRAGPCAGFVVVPPPFELDHVHYGVDQRQVCEGLREVSSCWLVCGSISSP